MKTYIIINNLNIVIDVSSHIENINENLLIEKSNTLVELDGTAACLGDEYDPKANVIISRTENHSKPSIEMLAEEQISAEMRRLAVASLKAKGILPADFIDVRDIPEKIIKEV